ncbi:MAG: flagellar biosynthesis protein FlhF [Gammaproteobacteria bacterium]|nr:flagellar biosynthesis protein FlhF [Gammaproteobacteria bacterium]
MKIKRFTGPDMRTVMRDIREVFGPDAVILESGRGADGLEVTAAMDFDPAAYQATTSNLSRTPTAATVNCTDEDIGDDAVTLPGESPTAALEDVAVMREEMQNIRSLLEAQLSQLAWKDRDRRQPETTAIIRNLTRLGLTPDIVQQMLGSTTPATGHSAWTASLKQLVQSIGVCDGDLVCAGGVFAIVGPTGVGKTTTIAKLAARFLSQGNANDVALVTMDNYRIGAGAQLATFGELMSIPVYQAGDAASLGDLLTELSAKRLVLIDTAGMGQRDLRLAGQLNGLRDVEQEIRVLLALPANAQTDSMQEIVDVFRIAQPVAAILTKIDEATSLGGAFSVLIRSRIPLAYVANGQRVPEDLQVAGARQAWLVKAAVELIRGSSEPVSEDYFAEHFAEVATDACA